MPYEIIRLLVLTSQVILRCNKFFFWQHPIVKESYSWSLAWCGSFMGWLHVFFEGRELNIYVSKWCDCCEPKEVVEVEEPQEIVVEHV